MKVSADWTDTWAALLIDGEELPRKRTPVRLRVRDRRDRDLLFEIDRDVTMDPPGRTGRGEIVFYNQETGGEAIFGAAMPEIVRFCDYACLKKPMGTEGQTS